MFGKKPDKTYSPVKTNNSLLHNSLVRGTKLEGDVTSESDFRIDGIFLGNLDCRARVIIGPTGEFKGEIYCENAIIEGHFTGMLKIREILEVREGAVIEGDVSTSKLVVESGSVFDVKCSMGDKNALKSHYEEEPELVENNGQFEEQTE